LFACASCFLLINVPPNYELLEGASILYRLNLVKT
jgi:hypothetical protein